MTEPLRARNYEDNPRYSSRSSLRETPEDRYVKKMAQRNRRELARTVTETDSLYLTFNIHNE